MSMPKFCLSFSLFQINISKKVESFNGKFRDTCLNQHWFRDLFDARRVINEWREHYNNVRPHSSLGYLPPAVFAKQAA